MRCFTEIAKTNPKVYAELFFYKSVREANDIEFGYDDQRYVNAYEIHLTFAINILYNIVIFKAIYIKKNLPSFLFCHRNKKVGWTEEQEEELRQLFEENQNNPSTEKGEKKSHPDMSHWHYQWYHLPIIISLRFFFLLQYFFLLFILLITFIGVVAKRCHWLDLG